ncbi:MAG: hydrogenase maturation protease [Spirochaetes bacterium]|nr:hydrogenase maturation protease [Spirochaetota bacterium]
MEFIPVMERLARSRTCFVGMGNPLMRDDAVGIHVVEGLRERCRSDFVTALNVEDVIENHVCAIADGDAEHVVIVDAVQSGAGPGSVLFGRLGEFNEVIGNLSTHKLSLLLSGKMLESHGKTVWLLGIEAHDVDFGTGLTDEVRRSADTLLDVLLSYINSDHKEPLYEH